MGVGLWLIIVVSLLVIIVIILIEGRIILRRNKSHEKPNEINTSVQQIKNEIPTQYVSSEKIRQLKENEEQKKRVEVYKEAAQQKEINIEEKKIASVIIQDGIRAGEVQRGEKEQFNLRKDEESLIKPEENGKWWI